MNVEKISVGVDISMDKFDCCKCRYGPNKKIITISEKQFKNNLVGFKAFLLWVSSRKTPSCNLVILMEATGVYHENLANFIYDNSQYEINILLPIQVKYYFKSINIKLKTDKVDAQLISRYGLERRARRWSPVSSHMLKLKQLSRQYRDLKKQINMQKNKLHAKQKAYKTDALVIKLLTQQINLFENQCLLLEVELKNVVFDDPFLNDKIEKVCTIPGVGFMTAITIITETNGFELITNGKQLCSYAGMDVKQSQSGKYIGKSKLSKQGNVYIRQAIYMPALSSSKLITPLKELYGRVNAKNKCKKVGLLAVARKLLVLIYTLWKKDEQFIVGYNFQSK